MEENDKLVEAGVFGLERGVIVNVSKIGPIFGVHSYSEKSVALTEGREKSWGERAQWFRGELELRKFSIACRE